MSVTVNSCMEIVDCCSLQRLASRKFVLHARTSVKYAARGCSSMVEQKLPKLTTRVRFPSPAPVAPPAFLLPLSRFPLLNRLLSRAPAPPCANEQTVGRIKSTLTASNLGAACAKKLKSNRTMRHPVDGVPSRKSARSCCGKM